jgi:hypothetical protein
VEEPEELRGKTIEDIRGITRTPDLGCQTIFHTQQPMHASTSTLRGQLHQAHFPSCLFVVSKLSDSK